MAFVSNAQKPVLYIKSDKYEGVIFSRLPMNMGIKQPQYIPTEKEITRMEKILVGPIGKSFFARIKKNPDYQYKCDFANNLQEYKRHYFGDWNKNDKLIRAFFFKEAPKNVNWKKSWFWIQDGGCDYFQIIYSIKSGTPLGLWIGSFQ